MKITKIDRATCRRLRPQLQASLTEEFTEATGLKAEVGSGTYSDVSVTFKVTLSIEGYDAGRSNFERCCEAFDLSASDYGREFTVAGRTYKLVGLKPRSPKFPIVGEFNGQRYKLPERYIAELTEKFPA